MKRILICLTIITLNGIVAIAQDSILTRIVLIGDGGQFTQGKHPVSEAIKQHVKLDEKTVLLFLGDNVYKVGLPDEEVLTYSMARAVLDSQLSLANNTKARLYMIPGNHDWNNGKPGGYETILREQLYVNILGNQNVRFFPENGCGGPVQINLDKETVLVIFDSQWWIHPYDKPGIESDCPYKTKDEVLTQLEDILARNFDKLVILASHHPFKSNGIHGGYFGLKQHIFPFTDLNPKLYIPLPVLGSIYPISRSVFGSPQDLKHPAYVNMINDVEKLAKEHPNLIFVAGHEHNLQLLKDSNYHFIVSGSGSKSSRVNTSKKSLFVSDKNGFATMEISKNKNVRVSFFTVNDSFSMPYSDVIMNFSKLPKPTVTADINKENAKFKDTVHVSASVKYDNPSNIQRWFIGENYRKDWSQQVTMPVLHLNEVKGGLKITGMGGGKQTKSLKLDDKKGGEWSLRTLDKDPQKAIPENFRNSIGADVVQDLVSSSHPYAALVIPPLAKVNGIAAADPVYYFVPDDPALGYYRPIFANTVCMLETRNATPDGSESKSTGKLLENMVENNDHRANQHAVLTARLLDMLVADWDRHFDQWKWATKDTTEGKIYYPIPKDRDQALAFSDGFLVKNVSRNQLPFLKGLRYNIPRIEWLNWSARDFDRTFMNALSEEDWEKGIKEFQQNTSDSAIEAAVKHLPPEVYAIHGQELINKLKSRRDLIMKEGMHYYRWMSNYVTIVGSNKREYFKVSNSGEGKVKVLVYERIHQTDTGYKLYQREFDPRITKELRLFGLHGNDLFEVDEDVSTKIKMRIIGGKGYDTFDVKGNAKNYLYDIDTAANSILNHKRSNIRFSNLPEVNQFSWKENEYPITRYPRVLAAYNTEDGVFLGAGFWRKTYAFRKSPFATENRFSAMYAFRGAYKLRYSGEFNQIWKATDLLVKAEMVSPTLYNFFGFGNTTVINDSLSIRYYQTRYRYLDASVLFRKRFFDKLFFTAGPTYFHYWNKEENNVGKILQYPSKVGLDSMEVYANKRYLGAKIGIELNNLNNELFPTRGIQWYTELSYQHGLNTHSDPVAKLTSDMQVYASLSEPARVVTVLRLGGGHIFNKDFEYFQALNLGANNILRGFRKNRFSGSSLAYGSLEVRVKLFDSRWYVLPGSFGVLAFDDVGRVWMPGESSRKWHNSIGGGIYYVPFNMVIISATMAFSKEEQLFNFSAGTKINITF